MPLVSIAAVAVLCLLAAGAGNRPWARGRWSAVQAWPWYITAPVLAAGVVACRMAALPWWPAPEPAIYDEFSYLLLGDTFAHGRPVNVAHKLWQHFEAPFVLSQPVYASVYPAAQGLVLAFGEVAFGHPWGGVLLSCGLLAAAAAWALYQWLPRRWAAAGSALFAVQFCFGSYWVNSYWGAAVSAAGGALVFGSLPGLLRRDKASRCASFAAGSVLLGNSRPYEGLVLVVCALALLAARRRLTARFAAVAAAIGIPAGLAMGWYFHRVTGEPWKLPHQAYIEQYAASPAFIWQGLRARPAYRHEPMKVLHEAFVAEWARFRDPGAAVRFSSMKLQAAGAFYGGAMFAVTLVCLPRLARGRSRPAVLLAAAAMAAVLLTVSFQVHYASPAAAIFVFLNIQALRMLWLGRRRGAVFASALAPCASVVMALAVPWFIWSNRGYLNSFPERADAVRQLNEAPGMHLVFVRYEHVQRIGREWVYNTADIDGQRIVWARDMGREANHKLWGYYAGLRRAWLLVPESRGFRLTRWSEPE